MGTTPQVVSWTDPKTGLVTRGITGYQSGSTGGINPTTMSQYLGPANQPTVPNMPSGSPYQSGVTVTYPDPSSQTGGTLTNPVNPNQWATDASAQALAQYLGGTVSQQQLTAPGGTYSSPQNQISVPGSPNSLNAGLVAGDFSNYGSGPTSYGMYGVQRDLGNVPQNQTYAQWALSQPGFQMNPQLANSGPGYNMVWNPNTKTYTNAATGQGGLSQADAISQMRRFNNVGTPGGGPPPPSTGVPPVRPGGGGTPAGTPGSTTPGSTAPGTAQGQPPWVPPGFTIDPRTGLLTRASSNTPYVGQTRPGAQGLSRGLQQLPPTYQSPASAYSGGSSNIDTSGLSLQPDINGAYTGIVSVSGQPTTIAITPDGRVFDTNGQDISSQFSQSDLSSLQFAFAQGSNDPAYSNALSQVNPTGGGPTGGGPTGGGPTGGGGGGGTTGDGGGTTGGGGSSSGGGTSTGGGTSPGTTGAYDPNGNPIVTPGAGLTPGGPGSQGFTPTGSGTGQAPLGPYSGIGVGNPYGYLGTQMAPGGAAFQPGTGYTDPYTGAAIDQMAQNNRNIALGQGASLDQSLQNYVNFQSGAAADYTDMLNSAYQGIASGQGGYSDIQKADILNDPYLRSLQITPQQEQSNYLTSGEQAAIQGDPNAPVRQLGVDEGNLDATNQQYTGFVQDALNQQDTNVGGAVIGSQTGVRGATGNIQGAADQEYKNISSVLTATNPAVNRTLSNTATGVSGYIDPNRLTTSQEYNTNYNVSPQDMQNILNQAGSTVGNQELSDEGRLMQAANAQGNVSPMALSVARDRMRQQAASQEAQAMTDAAIRAKELQLGTTQTKEQTRLGAEQTYAGIGTGSQLALGQQGLAGQEYLGQLGLTGSATEGAAQMGAGAAALGAEQYLGSQNVNAQQYLGGSRLANTQQLGTQAQQNAQWEAGTNLGAGQTAESQASQRSAGIAQNRQATGQANQGQEFGRGQYIYGQESGANTNFANQQLGQEQQYRQYLQGQQQQAQQNLAVGNQQRIGTYGTETGAANAATSGAVQNYAIPGMWHQLFGAKGLVTQGPHKALVGEAGPELLVDLAPSPYLKKDQLGDIGVPDVGSGESDSPETYGMPSGTQVQRGQDVSKNSNPLYLSIIRGMMGQDPNSNQWSQQSNQGSGGVLGGMQGIASKAMQLLPLFLAEGGVATPGARHFYGSKTKLHNPMEAIPGGVKPPRVELINRPQIRMLGERVPQAVVPLTRRPGNKVTPEMIPGLMRKFGGATGGAVGNYRVGAQRGLI